MCTGPGRPASAIPSALSIITSTAPLAAVKLALVTWAKTAEWSKTW